MLPIKQVLAEHHTEPLPPVLVIDEMTIKCTEDAGPVCGCDEKFQLIKAYKPFTFGGVDPYNRRRLPDECLNIYWMRVKLGTHDLLFEKPVAVHESELPENFKLPLGPLEGEDPMLVRQPKYTQDFLIEKLKQGRLREHSDGCYCRSRGAQNQKLKNKD